MSEIIKIPEECPVKEILAQISTILKLLDKVISHCEKCLEQRSK